jgi:ribosomal protein L11 methyltransferase
MPDAGGRAAPEGRPLIYTASIEAETLLADRIAARLEAADAPAAVAVTLFDRGGGLVQVSAYYATEPPRAHLIDLLQEAGGAGVDVEALTIEAVADRNWVVEAEALRGAVRVGRFLVHGSHERHRLARRLCTIEIDASLAFGTAHHASTKGCLVALDRLLKARKPKAVLDIGTGSGILAIAAAKVLNVTVLASDNDPVAVAIAADNARKNGVAARIRVVKAQGLAHPLLRRARVDLLFANLLLRPLLELAPAFAGALRAGGTCVLSGLLDSQAPQVLARFRSLGFRLAWRLVLDGWTTLVLVRPDLSPARD